MGHYKHAAYDRHTGLFIQSMYFLPITHFHKILLLKHYEINPKIKKNVLCNISKLTLKNYQCNIYQLDLWETLKTRNNYGEQMLRYQVQFHLNVCTTLIPVLHVCEFHVSKDCSCCICFVYRGHGPHQAHSEAACIRSSALALLIRKRNWWPLLRSLCDGKDQRMHTVAQNQHG